MQLNRFDGGLNTRIDPTLIRLYDAIEYDNVDNEAVVLKSEKDYTIGTINSQPYMKWFNDTWLTSSTNRDYVEYQSKLYYTEDNERPKKYDGTTENFLGIVPPVPETSSILDPEGVAFEGIAFELSDIADIATTFTETTVTDGNLTAATYDYKVCVFSGSDLVWEKDVSKTISTGNSITIAINEFHSFRVIIYRYNDSEYRRLFEVTLDEDKTLVDDTLDISTHTIKPDLTEREDVIQYTMTYYNNNDGTESGPMPVQKEQSILAGKVVTLSNFSTPTDPQVTHIKIYRIGANLVNFTLVGTIEVGVTTFVDYTVDTDATDLLETIGHYEAPEGLKYLTEAYGMLFGILGNELRFSEIDNFDAWPESNSISLSDDGTGILPTPQGILVFTYYTTVLITGTSAANFGKLPISYTLGCKQHKSCKTVKTLPLWVSHEGVCTFSSGYVQVITRPKVGSLNLTVSQAVVFNEQYVLLLSNGTLYIIDFRYDTVIKTHTLTFPIYGLEVANGNLYADIQGKISTLFTGNDLEFEYTSPVLTNGNHAELKSFNQTYMRSDGTFTVKIYIQGSLVATHTVTGNKIHTLEVPANTQRGSSIQYNIRGKGTVYTLDISPGGRQ